MENSKQQFTKQEHYMLGEQEKKQEGSRMSRCKITGKIFIFIGVIILVLFGAGIFAIFNFNKQSSPNQVGFDITKECVTHTTLGMHIHPNLSIFINGEEQEIPANVGMYSSVCMRPVHTHDATGKIHVEWGTVKDFTLGEFFKVWNKSFTKDQIFNYHSNDINIVTMTVNGKYNEENENLVLKDNNKILIEYKRR